MAESSGSLKGVWRGPGGIWLKLRRKSQGGGFGRDSWLTLAGTLAEAWGKPGGSLGEAGRSLSGRLAERIIPTDTPFLRTPVRILLSASLITLQTPHSAVTGSNPAVRQLNIPTDTPLQGADVKSCCPPAKYPYRHTHSAATGSNPVTDSFLSRQKNPRLRLG